MTFKLKVHQFLVAGGTTATLINSTGIIVQANSTAVGGRTYVDSTENRLTAAITAAATAVTTAGGQTFLPGDVIFVDWSGPTSGTGDEKWTPADEELMVVLLDGGANLTVLRGAFGTTATAIDASGTDSIFRLNTATMTTTAGVVGNPMTVLETKAWPKRLSLTHLLAHLLVVLVNTCSVLQQQLQIT